MSIVSLAHSGWQATIDTNGAWLETLTYKEQPMLFPRQSFTLPDGSTKVRGGCHVCLPNFGPGGASGLGQHGFGRDLAWQVVDQSTDMVEITLTISTGAYSGLIARLQYVLSVNGLQVILSVQNSSTEPLALSPGLHPYFLHAGSEIKINDNAYFVNELHEAVFLDYMPSIIATDTYNFAVHADGLPQWVLWTDGLADYVCLEPSYAGFGFEKGGEAILPLQPNQTWRGSLTIHATI